MTDLSHKTAIKRKKLSAPMRWAIDKGHISYPLLDYGCGHGGDIFWLGCGAKGYDPHYQPYLPAGEFATVTCNYVINVVKPQERLEAVRAAWSKVAPNGVLMISARPQSDVLQAAAKGSWSHWEDGWITGSGTFQVGYTVPGLENLIHGALAHEHQFSMDYGYRIIDSKKNPAIIVVRRVGC